VNLTTIGYNKGKDEKEIASLLLNEFEPEQKVIAQLNQAMERPYGISFIEWVSDPNTGKSVIGRDYSRNLAISLIKNESKFLLLSAAKGDREKSVELANGQLSILKKLHNPRATLLDFIVFSVGCHLFYSSMWGSLVRNVYEESDYGEFEKKLMTLNPRDMFFQSMKGELVFGCFYDETAAYKVNPLYSQGWEMDPSKILLRCKGVLRSVRPPGISASKQVFAWEQLLETIQKPRLGLKDVISIKARSESSSLALASSGSYISQMRDIDGEFLNYLSSGISQMLQTEAVIA